MVIINERILGLDHPDTAQSYGNLALYYQGCNRPKEALACMKRSHYLSRLVSGTFHPDFAGTFSHLGSMYQDMGNYRLALHLYKEALKCNEFFFGPEHMQTTSTCHNIALVYHLMEQYREALSYEKRNYTILEKMVGKNDFRTVESNIWLKQFTSKAVQVEIEMKKAQTNMTSQLSQEKFEQLRNLRGVGGASGSAGSDSFGGALSQGVGRPAARIGRGGSAQQPATKQVSSGVSGSSAAVSDLGLKPVNEVMAFINGTDNVSGARKGNRKKNKS